MTSALLMLLLAVFLSGGVLSIFLFLILGIRAEERRMSLTGSPDSRTTASTRRLLGVTVRCQTPITSRKPTGLKR